MDSGANMDVSEAPSGTAGGNIYDVSNYDTYDRSYVVTEPNPQSKTAIADGWECYSCGAKVGENDIDWETRDGPKCPKCGSYEIHLRWDKSARKIAGKASLIIKDPGSGKSVSSVILSHVPDANILQTKSTDVSGGVQYVAQIEVPGDPTMALNEWMTSGKLNPPFDPGALLYWTSNPSGGFVASSGSKVAHLAAYSPFSDPQSAYNNPDKGPHKGTPDDLFPDGVPLHGDLTDEQQAWLDKRSSKTAGDEPYSEDQEPYAPGKVDNMTAEERNNYNVAPSADQIEKARSKTAAEKTQVARWESSTGKHHVTLHRDQWGHSYDSPGMGGSLGNNLSDEEAIAEMQRRVDTGVFQPDANKRPMKRTAGYVVFDTATNNVLDGPYNDRDAANLALSRAAQGSAGFLSESLVVREAPDQLSDFPIAPW
jgi:hypothetical protein